MTFQEAWEFCSESLFFCRPKGKSKREFEDGLEIIFWENQMKKLIWTEPFFKNGQRNHWYVELTVWNPKDQSEYSFEEFKAKTYEKAIIKTAELIKKDFGEESIHDFYITDKKNPPIIGGTINQVCRSRDNDELIRKVMQEKFNKINKGGD